MTTETKMANEIHADEVKRGEERAKERASEKEPVRNPTILLNAVPNTPEYQAVLDAARLVDTDSDDLYVRAKRIAAEAGDLAREALRVRDQHAVTIDGLRKDNEVIRASAEKHWNAAEQPNNPTIAVRVEDEEVTAPMRRPQSGAQATPPPTLVHWVRRQVALHPKVSDGYAILSEPNVTIGDLRAWLSALDANAK